MAGLDLFASLAHADVLDLRIEFVRYEMVAVRIWELRHNLTAHDAWNVAVAEPTMPVCETCGR